jgi:hypothetical protein
MTSQKRMTYYDKNRKDNIIQYVEERGKEERSKQFQIARRFLSQSADDLMFFPSGGKGFFCVQTLLSGKGIFASLYRIQHTNSLIYSISTLFAPDSCHVSGCPCSRDIICPISSSSMQKCDTLGRK